MDEQAVADLQREWRQIVLSKLDSLEVSQKKISEDLYALRMDSVSNGDHGMLERRVSALEQARAKAIAVIATIQAFGVGIIWVLEWLRGN